MQGVSAIIIVYPTEGTNAIYKWIHVENISFLFNERKI